jgi:hypothetical protein
LLRRLSVVFLAVMLVFSVLPGTALAATEISLPEAITIARATLPDVSFPEGEFVSQLVDGEDRAYWSLRWYARTESDEVAVVVDARSGEVLGFNWYRQPDSNVEYAPIPQYTQEEGREIAESFVKRLVPEKLSQCRYEEVEIQRPTLSKRSWPIRAAFRFVRYAHEVPFPGNYITVTVNLDTAEVEAYQVNWQEVEFPSPDKAIDAAQAAAVLKAEGELELQYLWRSPEKGDNGQPFLAYYYPGLNNIYVDAISGELKEGYYYRFGAHVAEDSTKTPAPEFTPEELAEIEFIDSLLTKEEAEAQARETFDIPEAIELEQANLYRDGQFPLHRVWQLSFYQAEPYDVYRVSLNAETGEIYGFSHYERTDPENKPEEGTLTPEEAEELARNYIEGLNAEKLAEVELVTMPEVGADGKLPLSYYFTYRRLVEGIPFPTNYFTVSVRNDEAPAVTSYTLRWFETDFPSAAAALPLDEAYDKLIENNPFYMEYRLVTEYPEVKPGEPYPRPVEKVCLTWRLTPVTSGLFDVTDMAPLNWRGEPLPEEPELPDDVAGHWAEDDIMYLARVGIIQAAGGKFNPDQDSSVGNWLEMLSRAAGWNIDYPIIPFPRWALEAADQPQAGAVAAAIGAGLILPGEDTDTAKPLTRDQLAVFAVRAFGYEKVAAIQGIYKLDVADVAEIDHLGHVAIARGLGLLTPDANNRINARSTATNAQCAAILMRMLRLER